MTAKNQQNDGKVMLKISRRVRRAKKQWDEFEWSFSPRIFDPSVASLSFVPLHSRAKGGTSVEMSSAKYCGSSARSARSFSSDMARAYCSAQSRTTSR